MVFDHNGTANTYVTSLNHYVIIHFDGEKKLCEKKPIDQSIINFNEKRLTLYDQKLSVSMFFCSVDFMAT